MCQKKCMLLKIKDLKADTFVFIIPYVPCCLPTEVSVSAYGHENEMYNVGVNLKEGEGL